MEQPVITFALAKGRLAEQAFDLLEQLGIDCSEPVSYTHLTLPTNREV